ncbi:MAG: metallophosphoesterase [Deltaproteobacteria bacterium]|nr:metallophosphoesterase [Deltaproteobacteria bacterium]
MSWTAALVGVGMFGAIGYYEWRRLVHDTQLRGKARIAATVAIGASVTPMVLANVLGPGGPPNIQGPAAWPAFLGWTLFALTFVGLVTVDAVRLCVWSARRIARSAPMDPARRAALARLTGGAVTTLVVAEIGTGMVAALRDAPVVDVPITLDRLPRALDGFTIVQLTDLHVGATIGRELVTSLVARTNALAPDLIVLTGDLVDGTVAELRDDLAPLGELRAPHGVYFVTGNHEYYVGVEAWIAYLTSLGIRVLRNERVAITRGEAAFDLAGIDDHEAASYARGHGPDLTAALAGRDRRRAVVLLAHQPRQVRDAARHDVDLQLSGHTHGGQVWPWHYLVAAQQGGLLAGWYREGKTQLYVSRGAGYWGPPVRFGAPAELTRVILRAPA